MKIFLTLIISPLILFSMDKNKIELPLLEQIDRRISEFENSLIRYEMEKEISVPTNSLKQQNRNDSPEASTQLNSSIIKLPDNEAMMIQSASDSSFPIVEEIAGQVNMYDVKKDSFLPVSIGLEVEEPILFIVSSESELILSFPGKIAACVSENSRLVVGPAKDGCFEVELRNGTVSAMLDPERDLSTEPTFAIRTLSGVAEAVGTFYAVTEYKGQSYTAVKKGKVKKETIPPTKPDFSSYLKKKKPTMSSKN